MWRGRVAYFFQRLFCHKCRFCAGPGPVWARIPAGPLFSQKGVLQLKLVLGIQRRAKFITLTTGFVAHNLSIIAGILFGAGVGLPIGLVGCGAIGGDLIGGLVSKRGKVSTPKEAKELTKSFI